MTDEKEKMEYEKPAIAAKGKIKEVTLRGTPASPFRGRGSARGSRD